MGVSEAHFPQASHQPFQIDISAMTRRGLEVLPSPSSVKFDSRAHTLSSSVPSTQKFSTRPPSPEKQILQQAESDNLLTALAAHERRVLELKEELQKAEMDLEKLKKQWAVREAVKKRNELRHHQQPRPFKAALYPSVLGQEKPGRAIREPDRKGIELCSTRACQRKVFSGSRHTRTLSLLSPGTSMLPHGAPSQDHQRPACEKTLKISLPPTTRPQDAHQASHAQLEKDAILESGKQLVGDFRQGLWTFFEDLRQVTIGEDASNSAGHAGIPRSRKALTTKAPSSIAGPHITRSSSEIVVEDSSNQISRNSCSMSGLDPTTTRNLPEESIIVSPALAAGDNLVEADSSDSDDGWDKWDSLGTVSKPCQHDYEQRGSEVMASPLTEVSSLRTSIW